MNATQAPRMLFVNIAVRDLQRAREFFTALGFAFDARFSGETGACMVLEERHSYVMLLTEPFFQTLAGRAPCDAQQHIEAILCLSCESRAAVDTLVENALRLGARAAHPPEDHGFMYSRPFYDLDGHAWNILWMDQSAVPPPPAG